MMNSNTVVGEAGATKTGGIAAPLMRLRGALLAGGALGLMAPGVAHAAALQPPAEAQPAPAEAAPPPASAEAPPAEAEEAPPRRRPPPGRPRQRHPRHRHQA
jgi:hypothetical protein